MVHAFITLIQNVCDYKATILQMINQEKMQSCSCKHGTYKPNTTLGLDNTVHICTKDTVQKIFKIIVEHSLPYTDVEKPHAQTL
jgi:hypothetical protein